MPEAVIVPPPPTIPQNAPPPAAPPDNSPGLEQVQKAFDRVYPDKTPKQPAKEPVVTPPEKPPEKPPETTPSAAEELKIPSMFDEVVKPPAPPEGDEWPEELPAFKTPEESKERYKKWRQSYGDLKKELTTLRERPARDPQEAQRLQVLENQNRVMAEQLSRFGVEQSADFQQHVMAPLHAAWNEAARIVRDAGGDPQELAKAMSLNGKSQFEALDNLFSDLPESAKLEAHDALRAYRRFEDVRRAAVANAPKTMETIRARENERQMQELHRQRAGMESMFDRALMRLRDEAKVEVFRKTDDPEAKWWNEQSDTLVKQARNLFLENTDMDKVAMACLLAPAAETYRKLFIKSQKELVKLNKLFKEKIGQEPVLSESSGPTTTMTPSMQEDLKKPFTEVFLREFHKSQQRGGGR